MTYFNNFPKINYFNSTARNIILKSALISDVFNKSAAFFPYIVKDYERPDIIAFDQYGSENLDWVIYFSNKITDPYYDWPLFNKEFDNYLVKKYNKTLQELQSTISHYEYQGVTGDSEEDIARKSWKMTTYTQSYLASNSPADLLGWYPVYVYDYETTLNDKKRSIKLLSKYYVPQIEKELKNIFKAR
jgi:hypothetical protein